MVNNGKQREFWGCDWFEIRNSYSYSDLNVPIQSLTRLPSLFLRKEWQLSHVRSRKAETLLDTIERFCCCFVVEFSTRCHNCSQKLRGAQCGSCKAIGLQCVICHVAVRGKYRGKRSFGLQTNIAYKKVRLFCVGPSYERSGSSGERCRASKVLDSETADRSFRQFASPSLSFKRRFFCSVIDSIRILLGPFLFAEWKE